MGNLNCDNIRSSYVITSSKKSDTNSGYVSFSSSCRSSKSLHLHQLMTKEEKKRNVYDDYEVIKDIGEGSMGSVSVVKTKKQLQRNNYDCFIFDEVFKFFNQNPRPCDKTMASTPSSSTRSSSDHEEHQYALKTIKVNVCKDPRFTRELRNEIEILQSLDHPNIVRAIATYEYHNHVSIVMELCSGGDLFSRDPYTEDRARHIVRQITSAVAYMHRCGIMHRGEALYNIIVGVGEPLVLC